MSAVEIVGFILSLLGIWLATRGHLLTWPLQIIASLLYVYLFLTVNLFGESLLQLVYAAIAAYGWFNWRKNTAYNAPFLIGHLSYKEWLFINTLGIVLLLAVAQFQVQFLLAFLFSACSHNGCKRKGN